MDGGRSLWKVAYGGRAAELHQSREYCQMSGSVRGCLVFLHGGLPGLFCGEVLKLFMLQVQELHGSPWEKDHTFNSGSVTSGKSSTSSSMSLPTLSRSSSETSLPISEPTTPAKLFFPLQPHVDEKCLEHGSHDLETHPSIKPPDARPEVTRRSSHDLFECIEQTENKRLTEDQARYVFAQVADAVEYLDTLGIAHRDIKDENVVIDKDFKVRLNYLFFSKVLFMSFGILD